MSWPRAPTKPGSYGIHSAMPSTRARRAVPARRVRPRPLRHATPTTAGASTRSSRRSPRWSKASPRRGVPRRQRRRAASSAPATRSGRHPGPGSPTTPPDVPSGIATSKLLAKFASKRAKPRVSEGHRARPRRARDRRRGRARLLPSAPGRGTLGRRARRLSATRALRCDTSAIWRPSHATPSWPRWARRQDVTCTSCRGAATPARSSPTRHQVGRPRGDLRA